MTQEEKQLLLKDICARLPYKPIVHAKWSYEETDRKLKYKEADRKLEINDMYAVRDIKPYLRPMSSMTEEEKELMKGSIICFNELEGNSTLFDEIGFDWLNAHHFDYRGLIEKGLAIEAPENMYNI